MLLSENCIEIYFHPRCNFTVDQFWKNIMKKDLFVSDCFLEKPVEKYPLQPIVTPVCAGGEEGRRGVRVRMEVCTVDNTYLLHK